MSVMPFFRARRPKASWQGTFAEGSLILQGASFVALSGPNQGGTHGLGGRCSDALGSLCRSKKGAHRIS